MGENIRELALELLLEQEKGKEYLSRLERAVLDKYDYLDGRDKSFLKRVTEGTVERRIELDYYLNHFSSVPVSKMKPLIRCLLRMSVYQLLYMDNVPDSAVCNEACKLAVKRHFQNLRGFVNGVLRTVSRQKDKLPLPDEKREPVKYFSVKYSMPEWLVELWLDEYGWEITETLLEGLLKVHPISLRFRTALTETEREELLRQIECRGAVAVAGKYLPYSCYLERTDNIGMLPGFGEGLYTVQDVSSALTVEAGRIRKSDFVVDVCAAPGGKSLLAAEKAARVLARDISEEKTALIRENAERMRVKNIEIEAFDATETDGALLGRADVVFLDVPCSGLGVIGKKRDIKYRVTKESLSGLCDLQKRIVRASAEYVKPDGILVYSTCTIHRAENEDMVRFIARELPFVPQTLERVLPQELLDEKRALMERMKKSGKESGLTEEEEAACVQLLPGYMEADGFFIACFRRKG